LARERDGFGDSKAQLGDGLTLVRRRFGCASEYHDGIFLFDVVEDASRVRAREVSCI